jgi:hypothetical protein
MHKQTFLALDSRPAIQRRACIPLSARAHTVLWDWQGMGKGALCYTSCYVPCCCASFPPTFLERDGLR